MSVERRLASGPGETGAAERQNGVDRAVERGGGDDGVPGVPGGGEGGAAGRRGGARDRLRQGQGLKLPQRRRTLPHEA